MDRIVKNKGASNTWPVALKVTKQVQKNLYNSDPYIKWPSLMM